MKTRFRTLRQKPTEFCRKTHQTFVLMKTRRVSPSSSEDVFKSSSRRLGQDQYLRLGHTSSRRHEDVFKTSFKNVFKTSSRRLQDVLERYLLDVFKTYHQVKLFLSKSPRDGYLEKDLPRSHFWEIYGQCTKLPRMIKISPSFSFSLYNTFYWLLTGACLEPVETSTMDIFCENT